MLSNSFVISCQSDMMLVGSAIRIANRKMLGAVVMGTFKASDTIETTVQSTIMS